MQRKLCRMFLWIAAIIFQLITVCITAENTEAIADNPKEERQSQELVVLVSPQDLHVDQEDIAIDIDGSFYHVHSLTKRGTKWLAKLERVNYCPQGHLTCDGCGQCHTQKCRYFVRPCKLW